MRTTHKMAAAAATVVLAGTSLTAGASTALADKGGAPAQAHRSRPSDATSTRATGGRA